MSREAPDRQYDLILLGSGSGALTVASFMARRRHHQILVLDRHCQNPYLKVILAAQWGWEGEVDRERLAHQFTPFQNLKTSRSI